MRDPALKELLRAFPEAARLVPDDLRRLVALARPVEIPEGEVIFEEGDPSLALYLLLDGFVDVQVRTAAGEPVPLARMGRGDLLGEMGVLDGQPRTGRAVAACPVRALRMARETWDEIAAGGDPVACWLLDVIARTLAARVSSMTVRVATARVNPARVHAILEDRQDRARRWWEVLARWRRTG